MDWIQWALFSGRLVAGGLLLLGGFSKIALGPASFLKIVQAYQLLPDRWDRMVAVVLPPVEVAVGLLLVLGTFARLSSLLGVIVLAVVTSAAITVLVRGLRAPCGCMGDFKSMVTWKIVVRNGLLIASLGPGVVIGGSSLSLISGPAAGSYALVGALAVILGLVALRARSIRAYHINQGGWR
jgi:uncharacterized membrane protein YphA (DoxX/SURF4 family)